MRKYKDKKIKRYFICFTGIDGSGKSTISKKLIDRMNNSGIDFIYVYNRYKPFLVRPFLFIGNKVFLNNKNFFKNYIDYSNTKRVAAKNHTTLSRLYQYFVILDYFLQSIYKIKIPLILGKNIVCDRYIYDTVVNDLAVDFNYSNEKVLQVSKILLSIFPLPDKVFYIDVHEKIAFQRKDDIPSIQYLRDRICFFNVIVDNHDISVIKSIDNIDEMVQNIYSTIMKEIIIEGEKNEKINNYRN